jgi:hypothetical protein
MDIGRFGGTRRIRTNTGTTLIDNPIEKIQERLMASRGSSLTSSIISHAKGVSNIKKGINQFESPDTHLRSTGDSGYDYKVKKQGASMSHANRFTSNGS